LSKAQDEIRKRNQQTEEQLQKQYGYTTCSQVVRVTLPALNLDLIQDAREFEMIKEDVLQELKKFGKIISFTFPNMFDLN
jgi:hypothetical protein